MLTFEPALEQYFSPVFLIHLGLPVITAAPVFVKVGSAVLSGPQEKDGAEVDSTGGTKSGWFTAL